MLRTATLTTLAAAGLIVAGTSQAAISVGDVLVYDFGKFDQQTTGQNWNNVTMASTDFSGTNNAIIPVTDSVRLSDGAATGVGMTITGDADGGGNGNDFGIGGADVTVPVTPDLAFTHSGDIPDSAINDLAFMSTNFSPDFNKIVISDLDDSLTYDIEILARVNATRQANDWSTDGQTVSIDPTNSTTIHQFLDVSTDGSGTITILVDVGTSSDVTHINALEIVAIPEPASLALMGLGGLLIVGRRRKA